MSTKNLARTVIEGGRHPGNRWERRYSNKQERRAERRLSHALLKIDFDGIVYTPRRPVYRGFSDKLNPAERWLRSQVGRPWDKIRGELMTRFDTRTTAGRHIVFCHLLPSVRVGPCADHFRMFRFLVDRHGLLREVPRRRYSHHLAFHSEPDPATVDFLKGRRVGERDTQHYWFIQTESGAFRQATRLDDADVLRWRCLPQWVRERCDALAARPTDKD